MHGFHEHREKGAVTLRANLWHNYLEGTTGSLSSVAMMRSTRIVVVGDGDKSRHTQYEFLPTFLVEGWFADFCATRTGPTGGKPGKGV
jgi:hypothetical protein